MNHASNRYTETKSRLGFDTSKLRSSYAIRKSDVTDESKTENIKSYLLKVQDKEINASTTLKDAVKQQKRENEKLKLKFDIEFQENKDLRNLSILLNEYYHKTLAIMDFKNKNEISKEDIDILIQNYNEYIISQIKENVKDASLVEQVHVLIDLNKKVSDMRKTVVEKKIELERPLDQQEIYQMKEQIKLKHLFLTKKYDELDEFLKQEIIFQKENDQQSIEKMDQDLLLLAEELDSAKKKLISSRSAGIQSRMNELMVQLNIILDRKNELNSEIESLVAEKSKSEFQLQESKSKLEELQQRLSVLQNIKKSMIFM